jgi:type IV secretory pathway VirB10-like protein
MATTMPPQVAKQLRTPPSAPTRSRAWRILGSLAVLCGGTIALGYFLFRTAPPGVKEAMVHQATSLMQSATQDGYSTPVKAEVKAPTPPVDTSAEERRKIMELLAAMQKRLDDLEKRKPQTAAHQSAQGAAVKPPEKRPAPMLYLNKEIEDKLRPGGDGKPLYTLAAWATHLPCVVQPLMNSDVPGTFTVKITTNVYDTRLGQHLLVPQGATIGGHDEGGSLLYGNERLPTFAMGLTIEDRTYDLGQVPVMDQLGTNGLTGDVDNHFWRLAGAVLIGGALRGGQQALQTGLAQAGGAGQVASGIGSVSSQVTEQRLGRALDTRPTIRVFPGQVCTVLLTKSLDLPAMWQ